MAEARVREILKAAEIEGNRLRLTGQLARRNYVATNAVLEAVGGKWNRKARAHEFPTDPTVLLADYLAGAAAPKPARTAEGFVATPAALAAQIVRDHTDLGDWPADSTPWVLEPSAGSGALVQAALDAHPGSYVTAVEPNAERAKLIPTGDRVRLKVQTLEEFEPEAEGFDLVLANPPFSVPGNRTIWVDHVRLMWSLVTEGGRLVAIVPASFAFRQDRKHAEIRELVRERGGFTPLPDDAFKPSGTSVRTALIWMDA